MNLIDAENLADALISEHLPGSGWHLTWGRQRRFFGHCVYGTKEIRLSRYLVQINPESEVRNTILHEIAHALAGPYEGHGKVWRNVCLAIGARPVRCHNAQTVTPTWLGVCPSCGTTTERFRRDRIACRDCCDKYSGGVYCTRYLFRWERNPKLEIQVA